ncbi:gag protease polyprotein [Cucumis melo var. makuwa]|uniref:Gag protease polyprotein n=1 Tax=Cucumis melo var. makuwa TaxID=1194695 RepID=A0A5D3DET4_CUCMM|nr:gag protease polyprotein [Cucumis melo var. makuwa]
MKVPAQPSPSPSSSTSQHQRIAVCGHPIFDLLSVSRNQSTADRLYLESHVLLRSNRRFCQLPSPPYATRCNPEELIRFEYRYWNKTWNYLSFLEGVRELTLEFLGFTAGLIGDSSPLLGWIRLDANLNEILATSHRTLIGTVSFGITRLICASFEITRLICASFGITRLICVSFGITRLLCVSFRITRLICASFRITILICAFDGITRLIDVRVWRRADRRGARRMREGHMDASGFLYASADESLVVAREMPPRRGAHRGGRGGRGRRAGHVQPEVQPVAQATDPAAPVTHADLAAMEQRFRDLIMQMREQQQPAPPALAPAPVVPQDPTKARMWLSSLETIFWYMKCPEDQKVQCAVFMLIDRGTAWWETAERMLGGDVGHITWE